MTQRSIDEQPGDRQWIEEFWKDVNHLCGLVEESFETNTSVLLSPVMRRLISDHAKKVQRKLDKVMFKLCADNLNEPLDSGESV